MLSSKSESKPISAPVLMKRPISEPKNQPSTLVLWIRHAESCANAVEKLDITGTKFGQDVQKAILGKAREPVLSPKGVMEAYFMGLNIRNFFTNTENQSLIRDLGLKTNDRLKKIYFYCSFLVRTMITMKIISDSLKRSPLNHPDYIEPRIRRLCFISEKLNHGENTGLFIHNGTQNITTSLKTLAHAHYLNIDDSIRHIGFPIHEKILGDCCDMPTTPNMTAPLCFSQPDDYHNFLANILPSFLPNSNNFIVSHGKYIHENIHFHLIDSACKTQLDEINENQYDIFKTQYPDLQKCDQYLNSLNEFFEKNDNSDIKFNMDYFFDTLAGFTDKRRLDAQLTGSSTSEVKIVKPNNIIIHDKNDVISLIKYRLFWPPESIHSPEKHPEHHGVYNTEGLMCEYKDDKVFLKIIFEPHDLVSTLPAGVDAGTSNRRIPQIITEEDLSDVIQLPPDYQQSHATVQAPGPSRVNIGQLMQNSNPHMNSIDRRLPIYNCVNPLEDTMSRYFFNRPKYNMEVNGNPRGITFTNFLNSYDSSIPDGHPYKQSIKLFKKNKNISGIGLKLLESATAGGTAVVAGTTAPTAVIAGATYGVLNTDAASRVVSGATSGLKSMSNWIFGSRPDNS